MIIFSVPSKPFSYTGKGTTRRQAIIKEYAQEIEALYQEDTTFKEIATPSVWDQPNTLRFVHSVIQKGLGHEVEPDIDLFQTGCDRSVYSSHDQNALV